MRRLAMPSGSGLARAATQTRHASLSRVLVGPILRAVACPTGTGEISLEVVCKHGECTGGRSGHPRSSGTRQPHPSARRSRLQCCAPLRLVPGVVSSGLSDGLSTTALPLPPHPRPHPDLALASPAAAFLQLAQRRRWLTGSAARAVAASTASAGMASRLCSASTRSPARGDTRGCSRTKKGEVPWRAGGTSSDDMGAWRGRVLASCSRTIVPRTPGALQRTTETAQGEDV